MISWFSFITSNFELTGADVLLAVQFVVCFRTVNMAVTKFVRGDAVTVVTVIHSRTLDVLCEYIHV